MSAESFYRLLLRAYPRSFRAEYGEEMMLLFRDQYRSRTHRGLGLWAAMVHDITRSAPSMWLDAWSSRLNFNRIVEVVMKLAGIFAVLLGIYGVVGALGDAVVGMRLGPSGVYVAAISLGMIAAVLLLIAGATVLRSPTSARTTATITLVASLVMVLIARLLHPWMGTLALIIAVLSPIVILAALQWPYRRQSPA